MQRVQYLVVSFEIVTIHAVTLSTLFTQLPIFFSALSTVFKEWVFKILAKSG